MPDLIGSKKALKDKFYELLRTLSLSQDTKQDYNYGIQINNTKDTYLHWKVDLFNKMKTIIQTEFLPNVSFKLIEMLLIQKLVDLVKQQPHIIGINPDAEISVEHVFPPFDQVKIDSALDNLLTDLRESIIICDAFLPLIGVAPTGFSSLGYDFGPWALYNLGSGEIEKRIREKFEAIRGCRAYIKIKNLEGDRDFVNDLAIKQAQNVVHVLNLYAVSCRSLHQRYQKLTILGNFSSPYNVVFSITDSNSRYANRLNTMEQYFNLFPHEIYHTKCIEWESHSLVEIVKSLYDPENEIEERIGRAIRWYSKGIEADSYEQQFVNIMIAIEILLVKESGGIGLRLSERIAFLLGKSSADRLLLSQIAQEMYKLRSKIVHEGQHIDANDVSKLFEIDEIAKHLLVKFPQMGFEKWEDFIDWINQQKYQTPSEEE